MFKNLQGYVCLILDARNSTIRKAPYCAIFPPKTNTSTMYVRALRGVDKKESTVIFVKSINGILKVCVLQLKQNTNL